MKIPSISLWCLSSFLFRFCIFMFHVAHLSCFLPSFFLSRCFPAFILSSQITSPFSLSFSILHSLSNCTSPLLGSISLLLFFFFSSCAHLSVRASFPPQWTAGCLQSSRVCLVSWWSLSCRRRLLLSPPGLKETRHTFTFTCTHTNCKMLTEGWAFRDNFGLRAVTLSKCSPECSKLVFSCMCVPVLVYKCHDSMQGYELLWFACYLCVH